MIKKLHKRASASLPTLLWLMLLALLPAQLSAFDYTYEGQTLSYTVLDEDAKTVEVAAASKELSGDLVIPSKVSDGTDEYTVTSIGYGAFKNCSELTSVNIPNSVTHIGDGAFRDCRYLTSIDIPNSVTTIGGYAFYNCSWLKSVLIPNSVTAIGPEAFYNCNSLVKSAYPSSIEDPFPFSIYGLYVCYPADGVIEDGYIWSEDKSGLYFVPYDVKGDFSIPNSVTIIGDHAFSKCSSLESVEIPNSVTEIGDNAFNGCYGLKRVEIPNSVTYIGNCAFFNCISLKSVEIPNSVTYIGQSAFYSCFALTSVLIPNSVTTIGSDVFESCSRLKKSAYPSSIGNPFDYGIAVRYPTDGIIEDGYIWSEDKTGLYYVPLSVEGEYTLPASVASIGNDAFKGCGLTTVNVNSAVVPMMDSEAFAGLYDKCLLNVPDNLFADYMTTSNWHLFENINNGSSLDNGNFKYRTNPGDATAILVGPAKSMTEATILAKVSLDNKMYAVKGIGVDAFKGQNLTKVTFRDGIEIIGDNAFYRNNLQELVLPESVKSIGDYAFASNYELASVTIGSGVETIGNYAFRSDALTNVVIPASVKTIGDYAFAYNSKLASVTIGSGVETIGNYAFHKDALDEVVIPGSVKTIGDYAFAENANLASVTIGSGVETIGDNAFQNDALAEVVIPGSVKTIGDNAFAYNSKLASVTIGSGVETIGNSAFRSDALTKVVIPASVKTIGYSAFAYNSKLASVTIGSGVETIGSNAFYKDALTEIAIPGSVKTIGYSAFAENANLASVTIGSGVETIGDYAFNKDAFAEVVIPASVKTIGNYAFAENSNLASVTIGSGVETIGDNAFQNDALTEVVIPAGVQKVGKSAFVGNENLTTVIFSESVDKVVLDTKPFDSLTNLTMGRNFEGVLPTAANIEFGNLFTEITENFMANTTSLKSVKFGTGISEIPANAFKGCSLSEIVIPSNITAIGESAFESNKLTNVIIGCGTAEIGNNAFAYNNSIATINVTAVEPPVATDDVFSTQDAQLNVLKESREAYENAVCWYQFEGTDLVPVSVFKILNEPVPAKAASRAAGTNGKQLQFTVSVEPANASLKEYIFWESSNPAVATVDNNGLVTFTDATEGTAEITAKTLYDGVVASATVTAEGTLGIDGVIFDSNDGAADAARPNDIYNLQGVCLKRNASQADIDALAPGFYIVGGKKVLVK